MWLAQYRPREANGRLVQASLTGTGPTRIFKVGRDPVDVVPGRNAVWVLNDSDRTITRVPAKPLPKR